ncbi:hypothetical protein CVU75_00130 [Candidatus Dependentiae bacterium HGW-Dependentiae-1]|nr:MAG: hypothetical protein CVU75_00130 [Candidatus Dependentiae bacterium HGW-Dependentiae-1]
MKILVSWATILFLAAPISVHAMFKGKSKQPEKTTQSTQTLGSVVSQGDAEALANNREEKIIERYQKEAGDYKNKVHVAMAELVQKNKILEETMRTRIQELTTKQETLAQENAFVKQEKEKLYQEIVILQEQLTIITREKELTEKRITTLKTALEEAQKMAQEAVESESTNKAPGESYPATTFIAGAATGAAVTMAGRSLSGRCTQQ